MDIVLDQVVKSFPVFEKKPGLWGSVQSLFIRKYTEKTAVHDLSLHIPSGSFLALLGPNGSGKTTLMKMLSGILVPTKGAIRIGNYIPQQRHYQFLRQISLVMGQKSQLWWDLPAIDTVQFFGSIYDIEPKVLAGRLEELSDLLQIQQLLNTPVRKLSLGERMRCELLVALLHYPKILFLDEPTIGLDIVSQQRIRHFIKHYHQQQKATILLTSHNMADIDSLCHDLVILSHGSIVFNGTLDAFKKHHPAPSIIQCTLAHKQKLPSLPQALKTEWITDLVVEFAVPYNELAITTEKLLKSLQLTGLNIKEPSLDAVMHDFFVTQNSH